MYAPCIYLPDLFSFFLFFTVDTVSSSLVASPFNFMRAFLLTL